MANHKNLQRQRITVLSIVIFGGLIYLFAWSPVFSVRAIEVSGIPTGISQNQVIAKSGVAMGEKLARVEPRAITRTFADYSWIKDLDISRNWLSGKVILTFTSLTPVGVFEGKAIAADGTLFTYPGKLPANLPVVSAANTEIGLSAISLFKQLPSDLQGSMTSLQARNDSAISTIHNKSAFKTGNVVGGASSGELRIIWGSKEDMPLKIKVLQALLALPENKDAIKIDLSAPHAPIVK